jgi:hypothetical protein
MNENRFQTEVAIPYFPWKTNYEKKNVFIGSCFTENVGNKMAALKYETDINPFGILYNPVSVANSIDFLIQNKTFEKSDLIQYENLWHSFFHHGKFSSPDAEKAVLQINNRIKYSSEFLKNTDFLFITFGTAWVYRYAKSGLIVSNCHKIPAKEFIRQRLEVDEIAEMYNQLLSKLWKFNPSLKIIFTVSPIRHWKDGALENQRSKSILLLAIDKIIEKFEKNRCSYFPSYEIVMDELRDYRFYADDMIHLTNLTIQYIWEKFEEKLIDPESQKISKKVQKVVSSVNHKPINEFTKEYLTFLNQTLKKTEELKKKYPFLKFEHETKILSDQIHEIGENQKNF